MVCKFICLVALLVVIQEISGERCTPGETKQVDCNRCRCVGDGRGFACTKRACLPEERRSHRQTRQVGECYPGQIRQIDCNSCRCVRGGAWACTRRACIGPRHRREIPIAPDLLTTPCAPNDYINIDCNTCYCKEDRSGYLCTENFCNYDEITSRRPSRPNRRTTTTTTTTERVISNDDVQGMNRFNHLGGSTTTQENVEVTTVTGGVESTTTPPAN